MLFAAFLIATLLNYEGTVIFPNDDPTGLIGILDTSNVFHRCILTSEAGPVRTQPGDRVEVLENSRYDWMHFNRYILSLRVTGHGPAYAFKQVSAAQVNRGSIPSRLVSVTGTVHDIYRDDADNRFIFAVINSGGESVLWASACGLDNDSDIPDLIGSTVKVNGLVSYDRHSAHRNCGNYLWSVSMSNLTVLSPPRHALFDAPELSQLEHMRPSDIAVQERHRTSGRVVAAWRPRTFLIQRDDRSFSTVQLAQGDPPPCGETVEAVGFPESDLYTLNLTRAFWRKFDIPPRENPESPSPVDCNISDLALQPYGPLHGLPTRLSGIVKRIPLSDEPNGFAQIEDKGRILDINPGLVSNAFDRLEIGSRVSVTGITIIEKEYWRPNLLLPHVKRTMLVLRDSSDIQVLSGPPFWTPLRLLLVIALLIALILAILLRNRTNQKLADERINERTRLAAELHDTIAQNLTGAAIQLETAEALVADGPEKLKRILSLAVKIMHVSREELRDCIWDLRNRTLDEKCLADAFRRTLTPHLCDARLRIRLPVNRSDVSDRSVHIALSIARELVANAIHHGHAKSIAIAGTLDNGRMLFSVSDDGIGFDIEHVAGPREGHFGLTGIRERVHKVGGTFVIRSQPGKGTRAAVTLPK